MSEGENHGSIIEATRKFVEMLHGYMWVLHQSGRLYGSAGIPDTWIVAPNSAGKMVGFWFEAKTEEDKMRPAQIAFKATCAEAGVAVVVGRVGDVAEFLGYTDGRTAA